MRQPSPPGLDVLGDNGRNLSSVLQAMCQDGQGKLNLLSWIDELTPASAIDIEFPTDSTGKVLAILVEKNGRRISLASASEGTLILLAYVAAILGPHRSSFYFFEELEKTLHPTRIWILMSLFENQVKNQNIQVVATTNSPQLLGDLNEESLEYTHLICRLPDEPDSRVIRAIDLPDAKRLIKKSGAADLLASGWFERTAWFMQPDPDDELFLPKRTRPRKTGAPK
jgi:predicted ATPase